MIAVTDRACDRGEGRVSPLYMAVRKPSPSVGLLLREGYSPDAQDCTPILGLGSPLAFALSLTPDRRCRCVGTVTRVCVYARLTLHLHSGHLAEATNKATYSYSRKRHLLEQEHNQEHLL